MVCNNDKVRNKINNHVKIEALLSVGGPRSIQARLEVIRDYLGPISNFA